MHADSGNGPYNPPSPAWYPWVTASLFFGVIIGACVLFGVLDPFGWDKKAKQEAFPRGEACYGVMSGGVRYPSWYPPMFYENGITVAKDGHEVYELMDIDGVVIDQDCLRRRYPDPDNASHPDPLDINGDGRSDSPYYPPDDE